MYTHLAVPLDGSSFAEHALGYAVLIARHAGASLDLVLVHTSYSVATMDVAIHETVQGWQDEQRAQEATYLHEVSARLAREEGVQARPVLLAGSVVGALEGHVRESGADLVVMTTHGRTGLLRAWLGSVAEGLVGRLRVPVLLVRPRDGEPRPEDAGVVFRHVAVALDGSAKSERAVATALALAEPETRLSLLRVVVPPRAPTSAYLPHAARLNHELLEERLAAAAAQLEERAAALRALGRPVATCVLVDYHPAQALVDWAETNGADVIALSPPSRNPALRLLLGGVPRRVVRSGSVPVLVG